jgi:O-antigen ligase
VLELNLAGGNLSEVLGLGSRASDYLVRPQVIFSEPAYLGYFCLFGLTSALAQPRQRWTAALLLCNGIGIIVAAAAGPIAVAPVVLVLVAYRTGLITARAVIRWSLALIVGGLVLAATPLGAFLFQRAVRIVAGTDISARYRAELNEGSLRLMLDNPVAGIGLGNSRYHLPELVHLAGVDDVAEFPAANAYLGVASEAGIPLAAIMIALLLGAVFSGIQHTRPHDWVSTALAGLCLLVALQWLFIGTFLLPPFWLIYALACAHARLCTDGKNLDVRAARA